MQRGKKKKERIGEKRQEEQLRFGENEERVRTKSYKRMKQLRKGEKGGRSRRREG